MINDIPELHRIKETLGKNPRGMSISEIAQQLGMHRNTVAKYLDSLMLKGDVDLKRVGTAKTYFIATRLPASALEAFCRSPYVIADRRLEIVGSSGDLCSLLPCERTVSPGTALQDLPLPFAGTEDFLARCQSVLNGETAATDVTLRTGERNRMFHLDYLPLVFDDGREGIGLIITETTETLLAAEELARWRDRYRALADAQREYLYRASPDGRVRDVNEAFLRRILKTREEVIGHTYVPVVTAGAKQRIAEAIAGLSPDCPRAEEVYLVTGPDGESCWEEWTFSGIFGSDGELREYQAVGRDITVLRRMEDQIHTYQTNLEMLVKQRTREMKQANQTLMDEIAEREKLERELRFTQFAFDHASDSIILFDREGMVYKANRTGCRLLGYEPGEIATKTVFAINPQITPGCWERMWANSEENDWKRAISVHRKRDGTIIPVDLSRSFVKYGDREYFCSIARERV